MNLICRLLLIISLSFGTNYFQSNLHSSSSNRSIPGTLRLVGIMAQFPVENPDNPLTSGNGKFLNLDQTSYNQFYNSAISRCDGFLVDRPPHNSLYFLNQLEAVGKYYEKISGGNLPYTADIIANSSDNGYFTVSNEAETMPFLFGKLAKYSIWAYVLCFKNIVQIVFPRKV